MARYETRCVAALYPRQAFRPASLNELSSYIGLVAYSLDPDGLLGGLRGPKTTKPAQGGFCH